MSATLVRLKYIRPRRSNINRGEFRLPSHLTEITMKRAINIFGYILIALSIVSASGAAGDCDGKCMEYANSMLVFTIIMFGSVCGLILGSICIYLTAD